MNYDGQTEIATVLGVPQATAILTAKSGGALLDSKTPPLIQLRP